MSNDGERQLAIVTGAATGIGRAAALRLATEGYSVACVDIDIDVVKLVESEIQQHGGHARAMQVDVRSAGEINEAFRSARAELGPLNVLVCSAAILYHTPALEVSPSEWRDVIDTNLTGMFLSNQAAARLMVEEETNGRIVNIASVHSQAPGLTLSHYDASKGGVWMLTRSLALELAPHGITVNAVGPGLVVNTRLGGGASPDYLEAVVPKIPLRRAGQPEDIAGAIAFLCSPDASYITGSMVVVDGGMLLTTHT